MLVLFSERAVLMMTAMFHRGTQLGRQHWQSSADVDQTAADAQHRCEG